MAEITKKEFLELLQEFSEKILDPKFEKIDERFEKIDERFEKVDLQFTGIDSRFDEFKRDIIHEFHVISEDVITKVQLVAEGVINLDEKMNRRMDAFEKKNEEQHQDLLPLLNFHILNLIGGSQPSKPK